MHHPCASYLRIAEESASDLLQVELGMVDSNPSGTWEPNPGSVEEQPLFLTAEPALQSYQPCLEDRPFEQMLT